MLTSLITISTAIFLNDKYDTCHVLNVSYTNMTEVIWVKHYPLYLKPNVMLLRKIKNLITMHMARPFPIQYPLVYSAGLSVDVIAFGPWANSIFGQESNRSYVKSYGLAIN